MDHRPPAADGLVAALGSSLRRQLAQRSTLHSVAYSAPGLTVRRTAARTARRLAPETADRLIAQFKGTAPLLEPVRRRGRALRASAALTVAAVVGSLAVGPDTALAQDRGPLTASSTTATAGQPTGAIYPKPQSQQAYGTATPLTSRVVLVAPAGVDAAALAALRSALGAAGVRDVESADAETAPRAGVLTVYLGGASEGAGRGADRALGALAAAGG
ncbi:hypothetical protein ACFP3V_24005, partial [Streptacidiphilus monticola]